ncbi:ribonuclease HII [Patescibacteria group bacterium]|nr:ribonuclease HII [Patescibacteria group bacterium]
MILGIDEAGRGPWAGPLVVGAVVLGGARIEGLNDSKKLTKKRREELYNQIKQQATSAAGWVSAQELDDMGMSAALRLATRRAVEKIAVPYHEIIIDGTINFLADTSKGGYVTTLPKADSLIPSVSAASIVAKVERDRYMAELDERHPGYGFAKHAGYGVAAHRAAIERLGVTPEHRLSFAPLQKYASRDSSHLGAAASAGGRPEATPTTRSIGDRSETVAANYLVRYGHEIIARNWRTKYCEIDIISRKNDTLYFTEVKHRKNGKAGDGMAAITTKKQNQMAFAAKFYVHTQLRDSPVNLRLSAIATTGEQPEVTDYIVIE